MHNIKSVKYENMNIRKDEKKKQKKTLSNMITRWQKKLKKQGLNSAMPQTSKNPLLQIKNHHTHTHTHIEKPTDKLNKT